jgi:hypothetical protein
MKYILKDNQRMWDDHYFDTRKEIKETVMGWLDDSNEMTLNQSKRVSLRELLEITDFTLIKRGDYMRDLTSKQKALIRKWVNEKKHKMPYESFYTYDLTSVDDLTSEQYAELEAINDTEVLYDNVNYFIKDLISV